MLTQDPIGLAGGVNLYAYAGNNPIAFDDPYGLCPWCVTAALGAVVFGSVQVAANIANGRPAGENLGRSLIFGAVAGGTFGVAAPEATAAFTAGLTPTLAATATGVGIPTATNPALQNTIRALFRAGDKISGGTAGAIRNEALTGEATGGLFHLQKGIERIANLERILRRETLSAADRQTAQQLLSDLKDAVKFAQDQASK